MKFVQVFDEYKQMKKRHGPFKKGDEYNGRTVIEVVRSGEWTSDYKYRVLSSGCGHESIINHRSLLDSRVQMPPICRECANKKNGKRMASFKGGPAKNVPKIHPNRDKHLWAHQVWNTNRGEK